MKKYIKYVLWGLVSSTALFLSGCVSNGDSHGPSYYNSYHDPYDDWGRRNVYIDYGHNRPRPPDARPPRPPGGKPPGMGRPPTTKPMPKPTPRPTPTRRR